jgi:hypothetical protein
MEARFIGRSQAGRGISMSGAADFLGPGAIEVPDFESEIFDIVRRGSIVLNRLPTVRANGHPHRYFEQTAIATGQFTDPRNIAPVVANPTRIENAAYIKAIDNQTNISLFDKEVTQQQNQFAYIVGRDIEDIINGIELVRASAIWTGDDTSLSSPTTLQYQGMLNQITQTSVIAPGSSIIDGIKAQIALMFANVTFKVMPTLIVVNPVLGDLIDREAKAANITFGQIEVVGGVKVKTLSTQAGEIPIIPDQFLPSAAGAAYGFSAPPAGNSNYFCAILTEKLIEIPYISGMDDNPNPRLFQLGLTGNLTGQFVGIKFDCIIAKGASYAHSIIAVQRPTVA